MNNKPFLLNEYELSLWAFEYCYNINDDPDVRDLITDSFRAYNYCKYIKDRPEVRKNITDSCWAKKYCKHIRDDPEVMKNLKTTNLKLIEKWDYEYKPWHYNLKNVITIFHGSERNVPW